MWITKLALQSLWARRSTALLTLITIGLSVALLLGVDKLRLQAKQSFASTVSGTDLIVGARTGQIQLLLYSIFHIGTASNNLSWQSYQQVAQRKEVKWTIPISLGDSHRGYRVVGTDNRFFEHYKFGKRQALQFAHGRGLQTTYDVVVGAEVAQRLGYQLGDAVVVAHGLGAVSFNEHDHFPFQVTGVLAPTGTPVDRSVFVGLDGIEAIHLPPRKVPYSAEELQPKSITAFLVGLESRMRVFGLQRWITNYEAEPLMAILPGVTLGQLWGLLGMVEVALLVIASAVVLTGFLSMLAALLSSLKERRREMAILRAVGAKPRHVFALLLWESLLLSIGGTLLGVVLMYLLLLGVKPLLLNQFGFQLDLEPLALNQIYLLGGIVTAGTLTGLIPAWRAYRYSLNDGMSIRF